MQRNNDAEIGSRSEPHAPVCLPAEGKLQAVRDSGTAFQFFIPDDLLDSIERQLAKRQRRDPKWAAHRRVAARWRGNSRTVGHWKTGTLDFPLLSTYATDSIEPIPAEFAASFGWTPAQWSAVKGNHEFRSGQVARQGYCGWLLTNRQFMQEHDNFFEEWQDEIRQWGVARSGPRYHDISQVANVRTAQARTADWLAAHEQFLRRWDIAQLIAPGLPEPYGSQVGLNNPLPLPGHSDDAMVVSAHPSTMPFQGNSFAQTIQDMREGRSKAHLGEWLQIVSKGNTGKKTLDRYARLLPLRHYWRILHRLHPELCVRRRNKLVVAFAEYLCVDGDTLRKDLRFISHRLGKSWDSVSLALEATDIPELE